MVRPLIERVGRLQRLAVFEAAARLGSFTAAARELGMTQPAVTQHVRGLETDLGIELFHRTANRATPSAAGSRLQESIGEAFSRIEAELDRLDHDRSVFVLAANPGVAQRWLVPQLDGLRSALGDLDLRLWLFDRNADLTGATFDAAIHAGDGDWPGTRSRTPIWSTSTIGASPSSSMRCSGPSRRPGMRSCGSAVRPRWPPIWLAGSAKSTSSSTCRSAS